MLLLACAALFQTAAQAPTQTPAASPAPATVAAPAPVAPALPFSKAMAVAEINRLAISPKLDGKIDSEEWDPLTVSDAFRTYFQWQPGALHIAAKLPLGQDLVFSLDREADGWLIGKDNLEARVTLKDGKPFVHVRALDGGGAEGPHWLEIPGWDKAASVSASSEVGAWTVELTLQDPGVGLLPDSPSTIAIRCDTLASDSSPTEAFLPRAMTPLNLEYDRSAGLPKGLIWKTEVKNRSAVPGDGIHIRHTFNGNATLKVRRIEMQAEGNAKDMMAVFGLPFPEFDRKGRAFVDYPSKIGKGLAAGWYLQRCTVTTADGISGVMESSFRVAPVMDFDVPISMIKASPDERVQRFSLFLKSNSPTRMLGTLKIVPPNGWKILRGNDRTFLVSTQRGVSRGTFDLLIPAGAEGAFPLAFRADVDGTTLEATQWLNVVSR